MEPEKFRLKIKQIWSNNSAKKICLVSYVFQIHFQSQKPGIFFLLQYENGVGANLSTWTAWEYLVLWENKQNVLPDSAVESGDGVLQYLHDVDPGLWAASANPAKILRVKENMINQCMRNMWIYFIQKFSEI